MRRIWNLQKLQEDNVLGEYMAEELVFTGPWDTSFTVSTAASVQESA